MNCFRSLGQFTAYILELPCAKNVNKAHSGLLKTAEFSLLLNKISVSVIAQIYKVKIKL